jgi:hypothetical protein
MRFMYSKFADFARGLRGHLWGSAHPPMSECRIVGVDADGVRLEASWRPLSELPTHQHAARAMIASGWANAWAEVR